MIATQKPAQPQSADFGMGARAVSMGMRILDSREVVARRRTPQALFPKRPGNHKVPGLFCFHPLTAAITLPS